MSRKRWAAAVAVIMLGVSLAAWSSGSNTNSRGNREEALIIEVKAQNGIVIKGQSNLSRPQPTLGTRCQKGQIKVTTVSGNAGAGSAEQVFGFINISKAVCTLSGYPQVAALNAHGGRVAQAVRTPIQSCSACNPAPNAVTLKPGQTATAALSGTMHPIGKATSCPYYSAFLVTPPDMAQPARVAAMAGPLSGHFPGCTAIMVNPVVPAVPMPPVESTPAGGISSVPVPSTTSGGIPSMTTATP